MYIRREHERGKADFGWLRSAHSFSFGQYYDPKHMGISVLRVINDDLVQPGKGFGTHGHRDMEIISYVVDGELEHKDSYGNQSIIPAGDIQVMSAGSGITHSEYNPSSSKTVNFLQIWITPNVRGIKPSYQQMRIDQNEPLTPLITPDGSGRTLSINQDAYLYRLTLIKGEKYILDTVDQCGYLHLVKGRGQIDDLRLSAGDAVGVEDSRSVSIEAKEDIEALWFLLPI